MRISAKERRPRMYASTGVSDLIGRDDIEVLAEPQLEIRQEQAFKPIYMRRRLAAAAS